jgi:putative acetyltransferase
MYCLLRVTAPSMGYGTAAVKERKMATEIRITDREDPGLRALIEELDAELRELHGEAQAAYEALNLLPEGSVCLILGDMGKDLACACFKPLSETEAEVKRVFVRRESRRGGLARSLLESLEAEARRRGIRSLRLETGRSMAPGIALYRSLGYAEIPNYGAYAGRPLSLCMEKLL